LEALAEEMGLNEKLKMPGWRRDAAQLLACSDAFVLTSLWEGLPRALVEASLLGVPAVCYDTDGVRDLLGPTPENLIPQGDASALAKRVGELLADPGRARTRIPAIGPDFDIDRMVRQQEALYDRLRPPV
jgi:glycosyltransferase involved in cell wall biosynthesis